MGAIAGTSLAAMDLTVVLLAAVGAFPAGLLVAGSFGRAGLSGWALAALGAVLATLLGSAVTGLGIGLTGGIGLAGLLLGPAYVGWELTTSPPVLATWTGAMAAVHVIVRKQAPPTPATGQDRRPSP